MQRSERRILRLLGIWGEWVLLLSIGIPGVILALLFAGLVFPPLIIMTAPGFFAWGIFWEKFDKYVKEEYRDQVCNWGFLVSVTVSFLLMSLIFYLHHFPF